MSEMRKVFLGRFIHVPSPDELSINQGAILVDQDGTISKIAWGEELSERKAKSALGIGDENVVMVRCGEGGFFFPGFIGMYGSINDVHISATWTVEGVIFDVIIL